MDTELLKTFIEVQRTRHFGQAAENLYLTQSAVSFRIRQLEQYLGVNLFSRHRNNIQLTAAGERLLPHAEAMLAALQRAKQDVATSAEQAQPFSMAATANIWDAFLLQGFVRSQHLFPTLCWRADSLGREQIVRQLQERNLDLAILFDPPKVDDMQVEKLGTINLLPLSSHNTASIDNWQQDYIYINWGSSFSVQHNRLFPESSAAKHRTGSARIALEMMQYTGGSAYLPNAMVQQYLNEQRLHLVAGAPIISKDVYAAFLPNAANLKHISAINIQLSQLLKN
ncbi:HTH-type transcriptional regulator HdfR [Rheinheimera salexigens]|uniref:LysR family transcriptional regulator n=1 Tax=Rheinheimera salexigens TaxID=1628148 RepID=A0A1E7Q7B6_9GAMM|nr:HTH-type transcriptional regulator HdfR [Rheinheimera salexigens]OEY69938.1 LysR family transcriptional regulator [Rheinheimera salexigens]